MSSLLATWGPTAKCQAQGTPRAAAPPMPRSRRERAALSRCQAAADDYGRSPQQQASRQPAALVSRCRTDSEAPPPPPLILQDAASLDVSSAVVSASYRSTPWDAEAADAGRTIARIAFVSESGVCRSVLAATTFKRMAVGAGLQGLVECESKASPLEPPSLPAPPSHPASSLHTWRPVCKSGAFFPPQGARSLAPAPFRAHRAAPASIPWPPSNPVPSFIAPASLCRPHATTAWESPPL
jgi:hypothetical protein